MSIPVQHIQMKCFHCGDPCSGARLHFREKLFCCNGCKTVYEILNENGLCDYYALNENPGISQKETTRTGKFDFLDLPEIQKNLIQFTDNKQTHVSFYLPQIHCSSCLWLLENIHQVNQYIRSSTVNFITREVKIVFDKEKTTLREVVETLTVIGYEPHLQLDKMQPGSSGKLNRTRWYKIGVAGFCFSNIMMLSFPGYLLSGATMEPVLDTYFKTIMLILSIPVLFYSAGEFFVSAYQGLKRKYINIDAPVALALVISFARSVYEIFSGAGNGYFDSMSGIVFFMLIGRWLQERTYNLISFERDFRSFFPIAVHLIKNGKSAPVPVNDIKEKDLIRIHSNEIIPVDGILSSGTACIDYSFVNGENIPVKINKGEIIYAGGKQLGGLIELVVVKTVSQSYLTGLWNKEQFRSQKKQEVNPMAIGSVVDSVGKYFTIIVLLIGTLAAGYWYLQGTPVTMWNALTTVLIVACPCALLLSENFTYSNFLRILGRNSLYLKNKSTIEKLMDVDTIVFDKTGTLTHSNNTMVRYNGKKFSKREATGIASLLSQSLHPVADPIVKYLNIHPMIQVTDFKEITGNGIEGWLDEQHYKIGSAGFVNATDTGTGGTLVFVKIDREIYGHFVLQNQYRNGVAPMLDALKHNYKLYLLSGDRDSELQNLKKMFPEKSTILFKQTPEDKMEYIRELQKNGYKVLMIGDGLNDAGALKESLAGMAITDKNNVFTPSSDAILDGSALLRLNRLLCFIKSGRKIIFASFLVSAVYNFVGLYYAVQGSLSPLIAAILMPCSTITIVALTYGLSVLFARKSQLVYS